MDTQQIAAEILALETVALDAWNRGNPTPYLELLSPDITYFDPFLEKRKNGFESMRIFYEGLRGKGETDRYEMVDPVVQLYGSVAVLTYHLHSYAGGIHYPWNCTEVYRQQENGKWQIVHNHWSFIRPMDLETKFQ